MLMKMINIFYQCITKKIFIKKNQEMKILIISTDKLNKKLK